MIISNRYDFVIFFDVENGNPNGDPDAGNAPRVDVDSGHGYITDVCLKRKIRNYVELLQSQAQREGRDLSCDGKGYNILIKPDRALNDKFEEAYKAENLLGKASKDKDKYKEEVAKKYMCANYYDVRIFGAVMSTGKTPCGIVRGPVQINFARSLSPIDHKDITITRQARTNAERQEKAGNTEMGKKSIVPYAVYRAEGYISAAQAREVTEMTERDVELLWEAIINMFENDHSSARGKMCMRRLYVFKHASALGCCPSHILFDRITVKEINTPPRKFSDYKITADIQGLPAGVTFESKI